MGSGKKLSLGEELSDGEDGEGSSSSSLDGGDGGRDTESEPSDENDLSAKVPANHGGMLLAMAEDGAGGDGLSGTTATASLGGKLKHTSALRAAVLSPLLQRANNVYGSQSQKLEHAQRVEDKKKSARAMAVLSDEEGDMDAPGASPGTSPSNKAQIW